MSVGLFLLLKDVRPGAGRFAGVVTDISRLSYGIYLIHIMLLNFFPPPKAAAIICGIQIVPLKSPR